MASAIEPAENPATPLYDALLLDHIKSARNYRLPERPARALTGHNALCGDELVLYLAVEKERIEEIAYQASCCGICMASASIMTELVQGRTSTEAVILLRDFIAALDRNSGARNPAWTPAQRAVLEAARKYPSRARCASLPWTTLRAAFA